MHFQPEKNSEQIYNITFGFSHVWWVERFLLFQQTAVQSTIIFLFRIVDKISQTSSVTENSADAALPEDMDVSDKFQWWKWCLAVMATSDKCQWQLGAIDGSIFVSATSYFRMAAWKLWDVTHECKKSSGIIAALKTFISPIEALKVAN